jgi:hypothetical protein
MCMSHAPAVQLRLLPDITSIKDQINMMDIINLNLIVNIFLKKYFKHVRAACAFHTSYK